MSCKCLIKVKLKAGLLSVCAYILAFHIFCVGEQSFSRFKSVSLRARKKTQKDLALFLYLIIYNKEYFQ